MAWRKIKCTKSSGQKRSEFCLHLSWVQKPLALAWGLLLTIVVTSPISHCLWTSASFARKESSDTSQHPSCGHEMGWGQDTTHVIHGSIWELEVLFAFKSTFPIRTLLVPSIPLGGVLTHELLGKNGNGGDWSEFGKHVRKVSFLFLQDFLKPLLCYVVLWITTKAWGYLTKPSFYQRLSCLFFNWLYHTACRILVPWSGTEPLALSSASPESWPSGRLGLPEMILL